MKSYSVMLSLEASDFLVACRPSRRQALRAFLASFEGNPFRRPDAVECDPGGRTLGVYMQAEIAVVLFVDHANSDILVVRIRRESDSD